jgi:hypothetical protein
MPLMSLMGGSFGLSGFAGVGGGSGGDDSLAVTSLIPVGVAVGYRRGIGGTRGFSVYGSPMYQFFSSGAGSSGLLRVGLGVDAAVTSRIGVTVGMEMGQKADSVVARHGSIVYGVGVSFALGRR